jgi:coenzyme F420-reducing hydrogenase gamma subunit
LVPVLCSRYVFQRTFCTGVGTLIPGCVILCPGMRFRSQLKAVLYQGTKFHIQVLN